MQDKLRKILKYCGEEAQVKKSREELSELTIGLIKEDRENIKEEIADVKVMTKQALMFEWVNQQRYKRLRNTAITYYIDLQDEEVEEELQLRILEAQKDIIRRNEFTELTIAMLEYLLDRYMDINNISKEEIEKEMERKINRQLERIEREKGVYKKVICVDDDCCGYLIKGQVYTVVKVVKDKDGERYILDEIEGEYCTDYLEELVSEEEYNYENLAKEIDHAFYKSCDNKKCEKCKYEYMPNCRTLFVLDYLKNKGYKFKG